MNDLHGRGSHRRFFPLDLLFGSAAWSCAARDDFMGWDKKTRIDHLPYLTNNTRFLILPWIQVPHLASHLLGKICRRIRGDWQEKYGHGLLLLETFWRYVGLTKGRSRNDRCHKLKIPVKAVYLYPLVKHLPGGDLQ